MALQPLRARLPLHLHSHYHTLRVFSTAAPRTFPSSFLDLQARSVSRENGHFAKQSGVNYIEHSPSLQLLRSERDLAEGRTKPRLRKEDGILLTPRQDRAQRDLEEMLEAAEAERLDLQKRLMDKERTWRARSENERREWEAVEESMLRLRFLFGALLVVAALLAADSIALADDVEEHCPGCFSGNAKNQLFVVGYLKSATEKAARWWSGSEALKKNTEKGKHEHVQPLKSTPNEKKATSQEGMPTGWERMYTPDGRVYYSNHIEKYTTWLDPNIKQLTAAEARGPTMTEPLTGTHSLWQRILWASPRNT